MSSMTWCRWDQMSQGWRAGTVLLRKSSNSRLLEVRPEPHVQTCCRAGHVRTPRPRGSSGQSAGPLRGGQSGQGPYLAVGDQAASTSNACRAAGRPRRTVERRRDIQGAVTQRNCSIGRSERASRAGGRQQCRHGLTVHRLLLAPAGKATQPPPEPLVVLRVAAFAATVGLPRATGPRHDLMTR